MATWDLLYTQQAQKDVEKQKGGARGKLQYALATIFRERLSTQPLLKPLPASLFVNGYLTAT